MNLFEAILRANEEYTPVIQQLRDYIESQNNEVVYEWANYKVYFNLDMAEWDYVLTLKTVDFSLEFSQFEEDEPITIKLHSLIKSKELVTTTNATAPQEIIKAAFPLVKRHASMLDTSKTDEEEPVNVDDLTQCVVKVKDIGNGYLQYEGIILDASDYFSEQEMEQDFQDREMEEDELLILAYHEDGKDEFFDEDGYPIDLDMSKQKEFEKAYNDAIKDNPTVPVDKDNL